MSDFIKIKFDKYKFNDINKALYYFKKFKDIKREDVKKYFNEIHSKKYVKKYNKSLMGNTFSAVRNNFIMDIYFNKKNPYLLFVNINTRYAIIYSLKNKTSAEILERLKLFVKNYNPSIIQCDDDKSFRDYRIIEFMKENKIIMKFHLNTLHTDLSIINRLCRTLNGLKEIHKNKSMEDIIKIYNKTYNNSINSTPKEMNNNIYKELEYIYNQFNIRDSKQKMLLKQPIKKHDKVRYILDEDRKKNKFNKNINKYQLSKYYYRVENINSPFSFDIIANDGSIKTIPRYRLIKINKDENIKFADSIENESKFIIQDKILKYSPVFKNNGNINPTKSLYLVRTISRDEEGNKIKENKWYSINDMRQQIPTNITKLEMEYYKEYKDKYNLINEYLYPKD